MSKHRTTKTHHRKIAVAAVAVAAVGVPSVAMACLDGPDDKGNEARGVETSATAEHGQGQRWQEKKSHHRDTEKSAPAKRTKETERASRSASATPRARTTSAPATTLSATAPVAAKSKAPATTAAATTKAAASPTAAASSAEAQVVELVNDERAKVGCSPVKVNAKLTKAAEAHSKDMAAHSNMSHTGSNGSQPGDRIEAAGYSWSTYGENVAYGYSSAKSVMEGWMNSSGHKANILNCDFKEIGVGLSGAGNYWTQDFGTAR